MAYGYEDDDQRGEKQWRRLVKELERQPVETWRVLGLLGEPWLYPKSLYKVFVAPPRGRWWQAEGYLERIRYDPDRV